MLTGHCPVVHKIGGITVYVTDAGAANSAEIDMVVTAGAITEVPSTWTVQVEPFGKTQKGR
ncbi:hypothetical protein B2J88_51210 [Rhodococcus sp. SRB_17]|nr:hypothetical protein [Rhodococcus sp. SRB_17]